MSEWAQVEDVEDAWTRPFTPVEVQRVGRLLDRVEREIGRHVAVAARITAGMLTADDVRDTVVEVALRKMSNPGGVRSQTSGPFSQVIDQSVASGRIELTRADRRRLGMLSSAGTVAVDDPAIGTVVRHLHVAEGYVPGSALP